jgi:hypothetical protein
MAVNPGPDLVRWVNEGELLFRLTLQNLQGVAELQAQADNLAEENGRLLEQNYALQRELDVLRAERLEVAGTFKAFAEHVTQLATLAIQRLGRPGVPAEGAERPTSSPRVP